MEKPVTLLLDFGVLGLVEAFAFSKTAIVNEVISFLTSSAPLEKRKGNWKQPRISEFGYLEQNSRNVFLCCVHAVLSCSERRKFLLLKILRKLS